MKRQSLLTAKTRELLRIQDAEARVWDVLHPLMEEAANYQSSETYGYLGAVFVSEEFYPFRLRNALRRYSIGPYVSVSQVFPDSPAERADLREGDQILSVNGKRVPRWGRAARYASVRMKRDLVPGEVNEIKVRRGEETFSVSVTPEKAAYYSVIVSPESHVDIRPDGEVIWLSLAMVEDLADPSDFAYACSFALAQSIMRHPEKRRKNLWIGSTMDLAIIATGIPSIGVLGNASAKSKQRLFDVEADLIALYLLAAQGYDLANYPKFWEKQFPKQRYSGMLEKEDALRLEVQHQIIASIDAKRASGAFIFPEEYLAGDASEVVLQPFAGATERRSMGK
ncbi:M48 family metallopeptidase [Pelagicoccus mobilis]|nr:M48 family metallopeptidase [Pelagicoccus mobilis]